MYKRPRLRVPRLERLTSVLPAAAARRAGPGPGGQGREEEEELLPPPPPPPQVTPPTAAARGTHRTGRTRSGGLKFARSGGAAARRAIGPGRLICIDASAGRRSAPAGAAIGSAAVKRRGSAGGAGAGRAGAAAAAAAAEEHQ